MKQPAYTNRQGAEVYTLTEQYTFETGITSNSGGNIARIVFSDSGKLSIGAGFDWDGGSGEPAMLTASLAHEALYALMYSGEVDKRHRVSADRYYREVLKSCGAGLIWRNYCFWTKRMFGSI